MLDQTAGWNGYYRRARLAHMPELFVVRFFGALRNNGDFLSEHHISDWLAPEAVSILDFGCGNGRHLIFLAQAGWQVTGCDVSRDALAIAAEALQDLPVSPRLDVITGELPYESGAFDVVLAHGVFDHISQQERGAWIKEVSRVLKPKGLLYGSFIAHSLFGQNAPEAGEVVLEEGEEAGLTQTFYRPESIIDEWSGLFNVRSIAYDNRGLVFPTASAIEHRWWAFLERKLTP